MKAKILILNYEYPPLGGGAGVVSQKYAEGLAEKGNQIDVLTTWFPGEKLKETQNNLCIYRVQSRRKKSFQSNPLEMLSWAKKAIDFFDTQLSEVEYNLIIAFFSIPGGIVALNIHQKYHIPYIISTHGHDIPGFYPEQMRLFHWMSSWYIKKVWKHARKVLVLSQQMYDLAENFYPHHEKYKILPNGCERKNFYPDPRKKGKIFHIIFVGRLVEQKDPMTFLRALEILKQENIVFHASILGDGPMKSAMQKFVHEKQLENCVFFEGWKKKHELLEFYQKSHIQVCSSKAEAMSIAIAESLFSGVYILSTPVSGNTDMIEEGQNGEFFDIGDEKSLAIKLIHWSKHFPELSISENAIEKLEKQFDWARIIQELSNIISHEIT